MHIAIMSDIATIFENVIINDTSEDTEGEDTIKEYFISEAIRKSNIKLSTIISWEYQLAKFIDRLHLKRICVSSINVSNIMVDHNLNIVGDSIDCLYSTWSELLEVSTVNAILNVHKRIFEHLFLVCNNKKDKKQYKMLYTISNFYYSTAIKVNSPTSVLDLVKSIYRFYRMVDMGLMDEMCNSFTLNDI